MNYLIYLDAAPAPTPMPYWIWIAVIFIIYWFILRPGMKRHREDESFFAELKKGDKVVTKGGIHGKVNKIKDSTVIIEVGENMRITLAKDSISRERSTVKKG